jgi:hypothetical protein
MGWGEVREAFETCPTCSQPREAHDRGRCPDVVTIRRADFVAGSEVLAAARAFLAHGTTGNLDALRAAVAEADKIPETPR